MSYLDRSKIDQIKEVEQSTEVTMTVKERPGISGEGTNDSINQTCRISTTIIGAIVTCPLDYVSHVHIPHRAKIEAHRTVGDLDQIGSRRT